LLLECADEPLGDPVALRFPHERWAGPDPQELPLRLDEPALGASALQRVEYGRSWRVRKPLRRRGDR
jgi:hypothetical protein